MTWVHITTCFSSNNSTFYYPIGLTWSAHISQIRSGGSWQMQNSRSMNNRASLLSPYARQQRLLNVMICLCTMLKEYTHTKSEESISCRGDSISFALLLTRVIRLNAVKFNKMACRNSEIKRQSNSPNPGAELGKHQSLLSRLRGRHPDLTLPHTHRLEHLKTDSEYIVQFDGPADPYKPLNWGLGKKTCTTILYGFITMGEHLHLLVF